MNYIKSYNNIKLQLHHNMIYMVLLYEITDRLFAV